ncbi:MAG: acyltransferase family protein [Negativicutes bacterium]|nr:acyltransferase family protein [Negativicutes bacterium]
MKQERVIFADLLRITATFAVMLLHIAAGHWDTASVFSAEWHVMNFYNSAVRFCVPIFIMVSGMFFLDPERNLTYRKIYLKYILRIAVAFLFWSAAYAATPLILQWSRHLPIDRSMLKQAIISFLTGHYHLWFLYMIAGLYAVTPFLRKIVRHDQTMTQYFLLLSFLFASVVPLITRRSGPPLKSIFNTILSYADFKFVLGNVGYFVAGHYLAQYALSRRKRLFLYALGGFGFLATFLLTQFLSEQAGFGDLTFYQYNSPTVVLQSIAVFVFFQSVFLNRNYAPKLLPIISVLSSCSFGMYLVHPFILAFFSRMDIFSCLNNPFIAIPLLARLVFVCSFLVSWLLRRIPKISSYIT